VPQGAAFESRRYVLSLLWNWEVERKGPQAGAAEAALSRHVEQTLADLQAPESEVRERAQDEIYLLGRRGTDALALKVSAGETARGQDFLLHLLRWRIRPRTYARTGMDFRAYPTLDFRGRRQAVFDYARTAGEDSIPTLRAIVMEEDLEPSLTVRMGAAKALSGFRDFSGYSFLLVKHPDLTLKRPEVSRELALVQAVDLLREEKYQEAVKDLLRLLEESPFDFRANYHIAFAYLLLKDYGKAVRYFEIARRIQPKDQLTLYNLACAYALWDKKREALRALGEAVDAGFDDVDHIERDPDLQGLRDDPDYRKIVERAKKGESSEP
jgi:tetratricopeptide (TPR) repeat protein